MAKAKPVEQTDFVGNKTEPSEVDRAIRAVKDFQSGNCNLAYVRGALQEVNREELTLVAIGTRVPTRQLELLSGN